MFKRIVGVILILAFLPCYFVFGEEASEGAYTVDCKSAVLIEQNSGKILFEQNKDEKLPPASVTKVMTLLLIYEAVSDGSLKWEDEVEVSEHATGMGGSQIFLEPGEKQTVKDLTKSIAIASANDAAVAMAERIGGSEEGFVKLMNEKAKALGMSNTSFVNACGLDVEGHYTTAYDIALMSRELLLKYPEVKEYTETWQDTVIHSTSKGQTEFGLTNTNKLIKQYQGATGLKTGSTGKALYCLSGSATRNDMDLIGVIMAAPDPKVRFKEMAGLLDYGFGNFCIIKGEEPGTRVGEVPVYKGKENSVTATVKDLVCLPAKKGTEDKLEYRLEMCESITAPFEKGAKLGEIIYFKDGEEAGRSDLVAETAVPAANILDNLKNILEEIF
ncbi:MAG: D-alanyl-D-alanine carboxypeptidase [Clostridiales bacterium]|nr:D-alanyl-D-alanine carboxypeptidase [Clostridiales bacterium]